MILLLFLFLSLKLWITWTAIFKTNIVRSTLILTFPCNYDRFSQSCAIRRVDKKERKKTSLTQFAHTIAATFFSPPFRPRFAPARTIVHKGTRASQLWSTVMATRTRGRFYDKQAGKCHLRLSVPSLDTTPCVRHISHPLSLTSMLTTSRVAC